MMHINVMYSTVVHLRGTVFFDSILNFGLRVQSMGQGECATTNSKNTKMYTFSFLILGSKLTS